MPRTKDGWDVMVDMFFYRDPEEVEKQQQEEAQQKAAQEQPEAVQEWDVGQGQAAGALPPGVVESGTSLQSSELGRTSFNVVILGALDWSAEPAAGGDWAADAAGASSWGATDNAAQGSGWE